MRVAAASTARTSAPGNGRPVPTVTSRTGHGEDSTRRVRARTRSGDVGNASTRRARRSRSSRARTPGRTTDLPLGRPARSPWGDANGQRNTRRGRATDAQTRAHRSAHNVARRTASPSSRFRRMGRTSSTLANVLPERRAGQDPRVRFGAMVRIGHDVPARQPAAQEELGAVAARSHES